MRALFNVPSRLEESRVGGGKTGTFARLEGSIHPADALDLAQYEPDVMFQRIIHDGLLGHAYLSRFTVTWVIATSEIRLQRP